MKTMTCREMGGMCDTQMSANTMDEMIATGMAHLEVAHPEMYASVNSMGQDHPAIVEWSQKFKADWDALPENAA